MKMIITHSNYSQVTANLIKNVTNESDGSESQCYAMACLGALWLCRGEEGRKKILMYCQILEELSHLSTYYPSNTYLELIDNILSNKLPPNLIKNIKNIDKDFTILKILPISSVIHFLYFSPELKPEFPEILGISKFTDQDFVKSEHLFNEINKDEKLIMQLNNVFPNYQTITGQLFKDEYKLIESQWKCENGNITKEFSNMTLTKNGLKKFCQWLKETIISDPIDIKHKHIQMIISLSKHAISLQYDENTNKWYIVDSLNLTDENIKSGLNDKIMLDKLFSYLSYNGNNVTFSCAFILDKNININNITLDAFLDKNQSNILKLNDKSYQFIISDINDTIDFLKCYPKYKFEIINYLQDKIKCHEDAVKLFCSQYETCFDRQMLVDVLIKILRSFTLTDEDNLIIIDKLLPFIRDNDNIKNIMQLLRINSDKKNASGETPLALAIKYKNHHAIEYFTRHLNINLNDRDMDGWNALHVAAYTYNTLLVRTLLKMDNSLIDVQNNDKSTPLHLAVKNHDLENVKILLDEGANTYLKNANNETPLMLAITQFDTKSIECFINISNINLNDCNKNGWNSLHVAAYRGNPFLATALLEKNKSMIDDQNNDKCTALYIAVENNKPDIIKILLDAGANANIKDADDNSPLLYAIRWQREKAIEYLINYPDINLNDCTKNGWNALHFTSSRGNISIVKMLIEKNTSMLDSQTNSKDTALHLAVASNQPAIVEILLAAGANPDIKDNDGKTAEQVARINGFSDILKIFTLKEHTDLNTENNNIKSDSVLIKRKRLTFFDTHSSPQNEDEKPTKKIKNIKIHDITLTKK